MEAQRVVHVGGRLELREPNRARLDFRSNERKVSPDGSVLGLRMAEGATRNGGP